MEVRVRVAVLAQVLPVEVDAVGAAEREERDEVLDDGVDLVVLDRLREVAPAAEGPEEALRARRGVVLQRDDLDALPVVLVVP